MTTASNGASEALGRTGNIGQVAGCDGRGGGATRGQLDDEALTTLLHREIAAVLGDPSS